MVTNVIVGDIFRSKSQTLVNTVNCVGVMGRGIALKFKEAFPDMFKDYVNRCEQGLVVLGKPYLYKRVTPPWIINFPTKDHWRSVSNLKSIIEGLSYIKDHYVKWGVTSLAVPPLGCGLGGLDWAIVGPTLYKFLDLLKIPVTMYAPLGTPAEHMSNLFLCNGDGASVSKSPISTSNKPAIFWLVLTTILQRIQENPFHWPVGRTTFQKIAYFASEMGLHSGFDFIKSSYGPYSPELRQTLTEMVNNGLITEERFGRMFVVKPGPAYKDLIQTCGDEVNSYSLILDSLVDLFSRINTKQAEIAATVHFTSYHLVKNRDEENEFAVFNKVKQWKQKRTPPISDLEIATTIRNLNMLGWLDLQPSKELPIPEEF